jgi:hypothetical protein
VTGPSGRGGRQAPRRRGQPARPRSIDGHARDRRTESTPRRHRRGTRRRFPGCTGGRSSGETRPTPGSSGVRAGPRSRRGRAVRRGRACRSTGDSLGLPSWASSCGRSGSPRPGCLRSAGHRHREFFSIKLLTRLPMARPDRHPLAERVAQRADAPRRLSEPHRPDSEARSHRPQ